VLGVAVGDGGLRTTGTAAGAGSGFSVEGASTGDTAARLAAASENICIAARADTAQSKSPHPLPLGHKLFQIKMTTCSLASWKNQGNFRKLLAMDEDALASLPLCSPDDSV
jgi:hypothetical protein